MVCLIKHKPVCPGLEKVEQVGEVGQVWEEQTPMEEGEAKDEVQHPFQSEEERTLKREREAEAEASFWLQLQTEEEQEVIEVMLGGNPSQWPLGLDGHQHSGAQAEGAQTTIGGPQQGTKETVAQQGALAKVSGPPPSEQPPAIETSQLGSAS